MRRDDRDHALARERRLGADAGQPRSRERAANDAGEELARHVDVGHEAPAAGDERKVPSAADARSDCAHAATFARTSVSASRTRAATRSRRVAASTLRSATGSHEAAATLAASAIVSGSASADQQALRLVHQLRNRLHGADHDPRAAHGAVLLANDRNAGRREREVAGAESEFPEPAVRARSSRRYAKRHDHLVGLDRRR